MSVSTAEFPQSVPGRSHQSHVGATAPKTLLLVGSIPGTRNVGQILLREMLSCVDPDRYVIAALLDAADQGSNDHFAATTRVFKRPREQAARRFRGRLGGLYSAVERTRVYEPSIAMLAEEVAEYAKANDVRRVWAILNMTSVIDICAKLVKRLKLPLLAHVWDDVEHLTQQRGLDAISRRGTAMRFARLLSSAERTAVIGEAMSGHYTKYFGARCQIIRHGTTDVTAPRGVHTSTDEFVIGFSGGMYCPSAWKALQAALDYLNWRTACKSLRLVVMSGHVSLKSRSPAQVEYLGWRADSEVQERLSKCDLLYLPQPFEPSQRPLAELSFPTKLSAYVGTGRPVLIHGPEYASLVRFSREYPVGPVCTSLNPEVIAQTIVRLAANESAYRDAAQAATAVGNTVLNRRTFVDQVRSFLRDESVEVAPA